MGKVYDALRRAEEQRSRRIQETAADGREAAASSPHVPTELPVPGPAEDAGRRARKGLDVGRRVAAGESSADLNRRRITLLHPDSFVAEQFRTLRARLDALSSQRSFKTIAVTSAQSGDGKTLAAVGLASVTAMQPGRRVLLVDCDLRRPTIAPVLNLRVDAGLAEVLTGRAPLAAAIVPVEGTSLHVLPVRGATENPSELLASEAMQQLLESVAKEYDRVVLDLPPTLGLPDAKTVSGMCDGCVFVVRANVTPGEDVEAAIEVLGRERILGLVMNGADRSAANYGSA